MYDAAFFDEVTRLGLCSAEVMLPEVIEATGAHSVIDVGCGTASWASVAKANGCTVRGVDGHVPDGQLLIDQDEFERRDLINGVSCEGFDLALCMEVAEHLPESAASALVAGLCEAPFVLFSPAIPGQNGVGHINEQWSTWWEPFFTEHSYVGSSDLRWKFWADRRIANFYRQNVLIFAELSNLTSAGFWPGVVDVVHPERLGIW